MASKFLDLQNSLQGAPGISQGSPGRGGVKDITEVDSTLSTKDLMQRKLFLMKKMLRNEKKANSQIK